MIIQICASGGHVSGAAILGQRVHFIFLGSVLGLHSDVGSNPHVGHHRGILDPPNPQADYR